MRKIGTALAVMFLGACAVAPPDRPQRDHEEECRWQVCVVGTVEGNEVIYRARNSGPFLATVSINVTDLRNLIPRDSLPLVHVLAPGQRMVLTQLRVPRPGVKVNWRPVAQIELGSDQLEPDPGIRYGVPFGGTDPREMVGGYGGPTHLARSFYAMDFVMPEGTPVLAARAGIVAYVQDGHRSGGLDFGLLDQANLVAVAHVDGTIASYGHLQPDLLVTVGDTVVRGERLGFSGGTGFSGRPHLHFQVSKGLPGWGPDTTFPVTVEDEQGQALEVTEGARYPPAPEFRNRRGGGS